MTAAERQRVHNTKRREAGRVPLTVWVSERVRYDLRDAIQALPADGEIVGIVVRDKRGQIRTFRIP